MFLVILSVCILVFSNALVVREPRIILLCPAAEPNNQCPCCLQHTVWLAVYINDTGFCFHCYQGTGLIPHYCKCSSILWNDQYLQTFSKPAAIVLAHLGSHCWCGSPSRTSFLHMLLVCFCLKLCVPK